MGKSKLRFAHPRAIKTRKGKAWSRGYIKPVQKEISNFITFHSLTCFNCAGVGKSKLRFAHPAQLKRARKEKAWNRGYIKPVQKEISIFTFVNLTSTNMKVKNMLKTNDIEKKSIKSCKTGVIFVIWYFTVLPCSSSSSV